MDNLEDDIEKDILIFDTGGGRIGTIKKRAWHMFEYTNYQQEFHGYHDNSKVKVYLIVNTVTNAWIKDRYLPVLLVIKYETMIKSFLVN